MLFDMVIGKNIEDEILLAEQTSKELFSNRFILEKIFTQPSTQFNVQSLVFLGKLKFCISNSLF